MLHTRLVILVAIAMASSSHVWSQLTLTIDEYTTDTLTFTISGSLAANTIGTWEGWLGIKNDWDGSGAHTELFSSTPSITAENITIGGTPVSATVDNGGQSYNDSIYWQNPLGFTNPISALTVVTGSVTLTGAANIFDPINNNNLSLVSGVNQTPYDWARLEAVGTAIPEPTTYALFLGTVGLGIIIWRRRYRIRSSLKSD